MKIIVVDDSKFFCALLKKKIEEHFSYDVITASDYQKAQELLALHDHSEIAACLIDYRLPDAKDGQAVKLFTKHKIPTIVLISDITKKIRNYIWQRKIVDYVIKNDKYITNDIIDLLSRLQKNDQIKIAIVDDSPTSMAILNELLKVHKYQVILFNSPVKAFEYLENNSDIKMLITDYEMPEMNGCELTKKVRRLYNKQELAILGISSKGENLMSANFLKHGADDFIIKQTFLAEEFYIRVSEYITRLETYAKLRDAATKDFLTGIYNRRHFFEVAEKLHANNIRQELPFACALIDIDHFKKVNDNYGHNIGDQVICHIAHLLHHSIRQSDVLARFGGEEFCIYMTGITKKDVRTIFNKIRETIHQSVITTNKGDIKVTISIGVETSMHSSLDAVIENADKCLYNAKRKGRNKVVMSRGKLKQVAH